MKSSSRYTLSPGGKFLIWQRDKDGYWWHVKTVHLPENCLVAKEGFNPNPTWRKAPSDKYKFPKDD